MLFHKPAVTHKVKRTAGRNKAVAGDKATGGEMRLICPNCGAQYEVPEEVIPENGRDVQCSNCGDTWFQTHPDHPQHIEDDEPSFEDDDTIDPDADQPDWVEVEEEDDADVRWDAEASEWVILPSSACIIEAVAWLRTTKRAQQRPQLYG